MKILTRILAASFLLVLASIGYGAGAPSMDVTVSNASGKLVFKGKTSANGTFATGKLEPGNYVVQFNSKASMKGGQFAVVVSAGKTKVSADSVAGEKFGSGGVAMRVAVAAATNLTGQVASGQMVADGVDPKNPYVKFVNGKKYVWVKPETGSHMPGQWVPAEDVHASARNVGTVSKSSIQATQDKAYNPQGN